MWKNYLLNIQYLWPLKKSDVLNFDLITTDPSGARAGVITTGHGTIQTPIFMH